MNFSDFLSIQIPLVEKEIRRVFDRWQKEIETSNPRLSSLFKSLKESMDGGKRIRGSLVILGYYLFNNKIPQDVYKIAAAYEILQTALLIHDDVIDRSNLRRGRQTMHVLLGGGHYGISQAISLGDLGISKSVLLLTETLFSIEMQNQTIRFFDQMIHDTVLGQLLDVEYSQRRTIISCDEVIDLYRKKTALYTFVCPLQLGATIALASTPNLVHLKSFGEKVGVGFQIQDDLFAIFSKENLLGKSITSDILEGKKTLLYLYACNYVTTKQKTILDFYYGKAKCSKKNQEQIKTIMISSGAKDNVEKIMNEYYSLAKEEIVKIPCSVSGKQLLTDLVSYLQMRNY